MAIVSSDIKFKLPQTVSNLSGNGGPISNTVVTNLMPNINGDERVAGIVNYRKFFIQNTQGNGNEEVDLAYYNAKAYLRTISPGDDFVRILIGNDIDVQDDADGYAATLWKGVGILTTSESAGATVVDVDCEDASGFNVGDLVAIHDYTNREFCTVSGANWTSETVTLTLSALKNSYDRYFLTAQATSGLVSALEIGNSGLAMTTNVYAGKLVRLVSGTGAGQVRKIASNTGTKLTVTYAFDPAPIAGDTQFEILKTFVSSVLQFPGGGILASYSAWDETNAQGTYDEVTYPPVLYPAGAVSDDWTITFTDAAGEIVTVEGVNSGVVATGVKVKGTNNVDLKPVNGSSFYFKLNKLGFGGTYLQGDVITFTTTGSYRSVWVKSDFPPNGAVCGDDAWDIMVTGDTL